MGRHVQECATAHGPFDAVTTSTDPSSQTAAVMVTLEERRRMARSSWTGPVAPTKPSGRSSRRMSFRRSAKQSPPPKLLSKLSYLQLWRRKILGAADLSRKASGDLCGQRCCKVRADQRRQSVTDIWSAASRAPEKGHADRLLLVVRMGCQ